MRAALVVNGPNGNQLEVCALSYATKGLNAPITGAALGSPVVIGADVTDPTQLTWYDPNDLIVLSQGSSGAALQEVPVNGDSSVSLIPVPGMLSITSAGPANPLVAGLTPGLALTTEPLNSTPTIHKDVGDSPRLPRLQLTDRGCLWFHSYWSATVSSRCVIDCRQFPPDIRPVSS